MSWQDCLLEIIDDFLCLFLIFPLSILHWRGTWQLQDVYLSPDDDLKSAWISFGLGSCICLTELLFQPELADWLKPYSQSPRSKGCFDVNCFIYVFVTRLHLYIHGWAVLCYWRGLWNMLDIYWDTHWVNAVITYTICQTILIITRTVRTGVGVPLSVTLDTDPTILEPDTVYKTDHANWKMYILDCCFSQFVIVSSNIIIWRAIWDIGDEFIFENFPLESYVASLVIGFVVIVIFFFLARPLAVISRKLDNKFYWKVAFEDVIYLILTWANLMLWRGAWDLCIEHVIPDPLVGGWVSHVIGAAGLLLVQVFNTVGLHGIVRDGSFSDGEGIFDTKFLRLIIPQLDEHNDKNAAVKNGGPVNGKTVHEYVSTDRLLDNQLSGDSADDECSIE